MKPFEAMMTVLVPACAIVVGIIFTVYGVGLVLDPSFMEYVTVRDLGISIIMPSIFSLLTGIIMYRNLDE